jgi:hypothetical protein
LADIEDAVTSTDPDLARQLTGNDLRDSIILPTWVTWLGRMAFIMLPVAMFIPYKWWAALAVLAALVAAINLSRSPNAQ